MLQFFENQLPLNKKIKGQSQNLMLKLELSVIYSLVPVYQFYLPFSPKATYLCRYLPGTTYIPTGTYFLWTCAISCDCLFRLGGGGLTDIADKKAAIFDGIRHGEDAGADVSLQHVDNCITVPVHKKARISKKTRTKIKFFSYKNRPENDGSPAPQKNMVRQVPVFKCRQYTSWVKRRVGRQR